MKIAIVSGELLKKAIADRPFRAGNDIEWAWVDQVSALEQHRDAGLYIDLDFTMDKDRIGQLSQFLPAPVMVNSVVHTLREIDRPFIRINAWPGCLERSIHELAATDKKAAAAIAVLYGELGWLYRFVPDIPGMISGRVLATIINEAYYTLQEEISSRSEIDTAMKLGTNYPFGPFEWSERIGLQNIYHLLCVLNEKDSRYAPARELIKVLRKD